MNAAPSKPPDLLYHYTDAAGLIGIVTTGELWATDVLYLNDASEFVYIFQLIGEQLEQVMKNDHPYFSGEVAGMIDFASKSALDLLRDDMSVFIACFCEKKDLLSQWRGYARGTGGFAVGFKRIETERLAPEGLSSRLEFEPVNYDASAQRVEIREQLLDAMERNRPSGKGAEALFDAYRSFLGGYFGTIGSKAHLYKHPGFAEEKEWRITVRLRRADLVGTGVPRFRDGSLGPVPFVPVGVHSTTSPPRLPIREIVVGPTQNPSLAERSVRLLLGSVGYGHAEVTVTPSVIPLRA